MKLNKELLLPKPAHHEEIKKIAIKLLTTFEEYMNYEEFENQLIKYQEKKILHKIFNYIYTDRNNNLLEIFCINDKSDYVDLLLKYGADPNKINDHYKLAPIHFSVEKKHHNVIINLLKYSNVNINLMTSDKSRRTSLHIAVEKNDYQSVEILLSHSADPNIPDIYGSTPLHYAAERFDKEMVNLIMRGTKMFIDIDRYSSIQKINTRQLMKTTFPDIPLLPIQNYKNNYYVLRYYLHEGYENEFIDNLESLELKDIDELIKECSVNDKLSKFIPVLINKRILLPVNSPRSIDLHELSGVKIGSNFQHGHDGSTLVWNSPSLSLGSSRSRGNKSMSSLFGSRSIHSDAFSEAENDQEHELVNIDKLPSTQVPFYKTSEQANNSEQFESTIRQARQIAMKNTCPEVLKELFKSNVQGPENLMLCAENQDDSSIDPAALKAKLKCLKITLSQPNVNVRLQDEYGNTALHYANIIGDEELILNLLKKGSYLGHKNYNNVASVDHISEKILSKYFDSCLEIKPSKIVEENQLIFRYNSLNPHSCFYPENCFYLSEIESINAISKNSRLRHLLNHPLIESFLFMKWNQLKLIFFINCIFYIIFYLFLNLFIVTNTWLDYNKIQSNNTMTFEQENELFIIFFYGKSSVLRILTLLLIIILILREIFQFFLSPINYLKSFDNLLEFLLIITSIIAIFGGGIEVNIIAVLISSWNLTLLIGQSPKMSAGFEIFKTVANTFIKFSILFVPLFIGFGISFFILFGNIDKKNINLFDFIFKTFIMFTGEYNSNDLPFDLHPKASRIVFSIFVFLMAIILFNLLNGLAVSDTNSILGKAKLVNLTSRTKRLLCVDEIFRINPFGLCCETCKEYPLHRKWKLPSIFTNRLFLYPEYLAIKPYKNNIIVDWKKSGNEQCLPITHMDQEIVDRAIEIVSSNSERGLEELASDIDELKINISKIADDANKRDNFHRQGNDKILNLIDNTNNHLSNTHKDIVSKIDEIAKERRIEKLEETIEIMKNQMATLIESNNRMEYLIETYKKELV
ncbi:hypothetical protein HCN44_000765 [Aphidius gifuensis]|uniref:Transient receptor potential cation channel protein painless n=1 Tax=Aphidius gifuensis TaxID=684658 RepID=A0A834XPH1_APHGI|nr:hypothetical protein HCN44_000765 [Aphidius gifuensis]